MISQKCAIIEIGSNAVKYIVGRLNDDQLEILKDESHVTKLAENSKLALNSEEKILAEESIDRTLKKIWSLHFDALVDMGVPYNNIKFVATAALRGAKNRHSIEVEFEQIFHKNITVITEAEECNYALYGSRLGIKDNSENFMVFDAGAGSTEFIFMEDYEVVANTSIPLGAQSIKEQYFNNDEERYTLPHLMQVCNVLKPEFRSFLDKFIKYINKSQICIGIGGGIISIRTIQQQIASCDFKVVHDTIIEFDSLHTLMYQLSNKTNEERKTIVGLTPDRADIIIPSICIIYSALHAYNIKKIHVSNWGVRQAILFEELKYLV